MVLFICCSIMLILNDATSLLYENELVAYIKKIYFLNFSFSSS